MNRQSTTSKQFNTELKDVYVCMYVCPSRVVYLSRILSTFHFYIHLIILFISFPSWRLSIFIIYNFQLFPHDFLLPENNYGNLFFSFFFFRPISFLGPVLPFENWRVLIPTDFTKKQVPLG